MAIVTATPTLRLSNRSGTAATRDAQPQQADAQHRHRKGSGVETTANG